MNAKIIKSVIGLVGVIVAVWFLFGFFGVQALFFDRAVNEAVPIIRKDGETAPAPGNLGPAETTSAAMVATTSLTPVPPVPLTVPVITSASPELIARGQFRQGDSTYTISGTATITEDKGVRTLSLTDFDVTNGPDLFVYIVSAASPENAVVKEAVRTKSFVSLGVLKGNKGNQNYVIPAEVKLDEHSIVSIWCRRFSRNFGVAELSLK